MTGSVGYCAVKGSARNASGPGRRRRIRTSTVKETHPPALPHVPEAACVLLSGVVALGLAMSLPLPALAMKVISEKTATGFKFPESVAYDPEAKVLYVGSFGGTELKPGEKDNNGYISKASLDGMMLEERFLPAAGLTMNKPKVSG